MKAKFVNMLTTSSSAMNNPGHQTNSSVNNVNPAEPKSSLPINVGNKSKIKNLKKNSKNVIPKDHEKTPTISTNNHNDDAPVLDSKSGKKKSSDVNLALDLSTKSADDSSNIMRRKFNSDRDFVASQFKKIFGVHFESVQHSKQGLSGENKSVFAITSSNVIPNQKDIALSQSKENESDHNERPLKFNRTASIKRSNPWMKEKPTKNECFLESLRVINHHKMEKPFPKIVPCNELSSKAIPKTTINSFDDVQPKSGRVLKQNQYKLEVIKNLKEKEKGKGPVTSSRSKPTK